MTPSFGRSCVAVQSSDTEPSDTKIWLVAVENAALVHDPNTIDDTRDARPNLLIWPRCCVRDEATLDRARCSQRCVFIKGPEKLVKCSPLNRSYMPRQSSTTQRTSLRDRKTCSGRRARDQRAPRRFHLNVVVEIKCAPRAGLSVHASAPMAPYKHDRCSANTRQDGSKVEPRLKKRSMTACTCFKVCLIPIRFAAECILCVAHDILPSSIRFEAVAKPC